MPAAREPKMEDPTGLRLRAVALEIIQHFPVLRLSQNVGGVRSTHVEKRCQNISSCDNEKQERNRNGESGAASQAFLIRSRRIKKTAKR